MAYADSLLDQRFDVRIRQMDAVRGENRRHVQQPEVVEPLDGGPAELAEAVLDLLSGLGDVNVDADLRLASGLDDPAKEMVRAGVGRMRPEHRDQQAPASVTPLPRELDGRLQASPGVGEKPEQDARDVRPDAAVNHRTGGRLEVVVHVVEAGDAPADHLHDPQHRAPVDVLLLQLHLQRPDALLQPGLQRHVVGVAAQQRHRTVRVRVDEAGHRHHAFGVDRLVSRHLPWGLIGRPQSRYVSSLDEEVGAGQHGSLVVNGHHGGVPDQPASQVSSSL